jgi:neutral amino acid transport system permease protein
VVFLIAMSTLLATTALLQYTRIGKATRAVADNPALSAASGINVDGVIRIVWIAGGALAGLAGLLLGIAQQVNFQMGFQILLLIFASVTLGGLGTAFGALVGSLVVGIVVEMSTLWIPAELKYVGALAILIVILLVRPQGILGRAQRVG